MSSKQTPRIVNKRAKFDYELVDRFLAGIILAGYEAKSLRLGYGDLRGSYVTLKKAEVWLTNAYISPYKFASLNDDYDPRRSRKLLLNHSEIEKLLIAKNSGLTIVATKFLIEARFIKLEIHTARGRKKYDKRQYIRKRQHDRDAHNV